MPTPNQPLRPQPEETRPLLEKFLGLKEGNSEIASGILGGLALEVARRGGRLNIDNNGITIEVDGITTCLVPTNGPDEETRTLVKVDARMMKGERGSTLDKWIAGARVLLFRESNLR